MRQDTASRREATPPRLERVERRSGLDRDRFAAGYRRPGRPVVLTDVASRWPAMARWTPEFFRAHYGDLEVPVYAGVGHGAGYLSPVAHMRFADYLDRLMSGPVDLRLFLFNLLAQAPELRADYSEPPLMERFARRAPPFFFGGETAHVPLHHDIDLAHLFRAQVFGVCRVILFPPSESPWLYRHPFTVRSYVDVDRPDDVRHALFRRARGYEVVCSPGDLLYMPSGFWHDVTYLSAGWALTLRAPPAGLPRLLGLRNVAVLLPIDRLMNRVAPEAWFAWKEKSAGRRARRSRPGRRPGQEP
ncbi:MAG: cupin-like domain-containing protein [Acidobacteriota bacterium]